MKEIIGFHGTKNICAGSIVSDNFKVATKRKNDNHWLGHGIYFYADYELAEWWANTKVKVHNEKYNQNDKASVIKAKQLKIFLI